MADKAFPILVLFFLCFSWLILLTWGLWISQRAVKQLQRFELKRQGEELR